MIKTPTFLASRYVREREQNRVPVQVASDRSITLSPGDHSELMKAIIEDFAPRFAPGGVLVHVGDTGEKWGYFDATLLSKLGVELDTHGKMPDVVLYYAAKYWLLLAEAVTSHGPMDGKLSAELSKLVSESTTRWVFVTAFPNCSNLAKHLGEIAWETEVRASESPSHLIRFNGERFLGPY